MDNLIALLITLVMIAWLYRISNELKGIKEVLTEFKSNTKGREK